MRMSSLLEHPHTCSFDERSDRESRAFEVLTDGRSNRESKAFEVLPDTIRREEEYYDINF